MKKMTKVLIANRGEIAVRVIRACREMGLLTVAVCSEVDRLAPHALAADEVVEIGPAPPLESYLNIDNVLKAAADTGCDALHPGYGFLSENAVFARRCIAAGLNFIGPSAESIEQVGDKLKAREAMLNAGVPQTPGAEIKGLSEKDVRKLAEDIGFPVMVKAAAGGGGKGMRVVHNADDLMSAVEAGQREAGSAFGDDTVYMEKFIERPRHIEYQVLADTHGNTVHLFERECSIQRRHQKIVEETPSPALDDELRERMGKTACRVMEAVNYTSAGTVEFLLDEEKNFYFLEVNARIQVEHPVTEMVTGIDLVKQQIRVARGEKLAFKQSDITQRGHSIECRIYAENAETNFLPSIGKLQLVKEPAGPGIRVDSGVRTGMDVTHFYDPILSKLIVWDETREAAISRLTLALSDYVILGVETPLAFLKELINHPAFVSGDLHTGFLPEHFADWKNEPAEPEKVLALLAAAAFASKGKTAVRAEGDREDPTPWQSLGDWQMS
ncbi:MAG: acetyl-CoA carboxylase biotin carboxylase subunit [Calditrichia bacterium]